LDNLHGFGENKRLTYWCYRPMPFSSSSTLHIATVHWRCADWIDIQLDYLKRYCGCQIKLYAYLNDVPQAHHGKFDYVDTADDLGHAEKLNNLAQVIISRAEADDYLLFIDGDAFPVAQLGPFYQQLGQYPLIAVQRQENNGDQQPHPCFCLTTVKFWESIGGDWRPGGYWMDHSGRRITDVGGKLKDILEEGGHSWLPLLRSNQKDLHPLWFAVYGGMAYHHGAGFRDQLCRLDAMRGIDLFSRCVINLQRNLKTAQRFPLLHQRIRHRINNYMRNKNQRMADKVYQKIQQGSNFCQFFGLTGGGKSE
jgi:hypothetical protein